MATSGDAAHESPSSRNAATPLVVCNAEAIVPTLPQRTATRPPWHGAPTLGCAGTKKGRPMTQQWIYERSADATARFVLGTVGENPLVCFGINPSIAVPNAPDRTVGRVTRFAADNGFDS